jgi:ADP-heptose:LPS heptosyltransferase
MAGGRAAVDHSAALGDYADTAAAVSLMDLVISVDTSLAHLAGALGWPVWIMLAFSAEWRWLIDRTDSPWYPTARLFRQPQAGDWDSVLAEVEAALRARLQRPTA